MTRDARDRGHHARTGSYPPRRHRRRGRGSSPCQWAKPNELEVTLVDKSPWHEYRPSYALDPPEGFDPIAYVTSSLASVPWTWAIEVELDLPLDRAAARIPATLGQLVAEEDATVLRMSVESLDWMASLLAGLGCDFTIRRPDELRVSVRELAARLASV